VQGYLQVIQILLSIALIAIILLQVRGASLGSAFGGSDTIHHTRRGLDKLLFNVTIGIAVIFLLVSLLILRV
jgi:preprotein translocase subunit SecG